METPNLHWGTDHGQSAATAPKAATVMERSSQKAGGVPSILENRRLIAIEERTRLRILRRNYRMGFASGALNCPQDRTEPPCYRFRAAILSCQSP